MKTPHSSFHSIEPRRVSKTAFLSVSAPLREKKRKHYPAETLGR